MTTRIEWIDPMPVTAGVVRAVAALRDAGRLPGGTLVLDRPRLAAMIGCEHGPLAERPCAACTGSD